MRTIGILQARTGSSRLPSKIHRRVLDDFSVLDVIASRLSLTAIEWWLATTSLPSDNRLVSRARRLGFRVYRGDTKDVLSRFEHIVLRQKPNWVIRATGDNPAISFEAVNQLIRYVEVEKPHNVSMVAENPTRRLYPIGHVPQIVSAESILQIRGQISPAESHHLLHVTSAFHAMGNVLGLSRDIVDIGEPRPNYRWTVDEFDDLTYMREMFRQAGSDSSALSATYARLAEVVDENPHLCKINENVEQKKVEAG